MNKLLISTAYNPPIIYFATILLQKDVCIETYETFQKQTWRNRCSILTSQGVMDLTIPVKRSNDSKTGEVEIDFSQKWQNNHWRAIESAYNKSPFFMYYKDDLQQLIYSKEQNLVCYNELILKFYLRMFKIDATISYTDDYKKTNSNVWDLRERLHPKKNALIDNALFPQYYQLFGNQFYPNLSILDLLNNEGHDGIDYLLNLSAILKEQIKLID